VHIRLDDYVSPLEILLKFLPAFRLHQHEIGSMRINSKTKRFRLFIATPSLLTTRLLLAALFVLAGVAQLPAQNVVLTGALSGRVTDQSGAVVAGALLAVQNLQTGVSRSAETSNTGLYCFPVLTPGFYSIDWITCKVVLF